jgi:DNA-binding LytR/AlgR family response regulator
MKPVKILIVEDKRLVAESLASTLIKVGYSITGKAVSGEQVMEMVEKEIPDIILMDIQLAGELDGIQTVEQLNKVYTIPIIYLTDSHDKTTIDRAKHTRPAAYLIKPYQRKDLLVAIEIAFYNASQGTTAVPDKKEKITATIFPLNDRFFIKEKDILTRIDISDILWIKADRAYYEIKTMQKTYAQVGNLSLFNKKFNHPMLVRVHRSYIVNVDKVTAIKGNMLIIAGANNEEIPMSEGYREDVNKRLLRI